MRKNDFYCNVIPDTSPEGLLKMIRDLADPAEPQFRLSQGRSGWGVAFISSGEMSPLMECSKEQKGRRGTF